jgi:hypothetical protein
VLPGPTAVSARSRAATTAVPRGAGATGDGLPPSSGASRPRFGLVAVAGWLGLHVAVGVGGAISPMVATAHAGVTIVAAVVLLFGSARPERLVAVAAYGGTCDVFWRMTGSRAPWELSKYLLAAGAIALLVRFVHRWPRGGVPIAFLLVLVPGMVVAVAALGVGAGREALSSTEMGLLSFGVAALAFRHLVASREDAWAMGWVALGPLVCVLAVTTYSLVTSPDIDFGSESNFAATGGYGPNQVSSALGLIMLICALLAFLPQARTLWPVLAGLGVWSVWAAFLTFSRGGVYSLVIAAGAMTLVGITTRGNRTRSLVILTVGAVGLLLTFSSANDFSGNWLDSRYGSASTAGRTSIAELDMEVFGSHPLMGVGSNRAQEYRPDTNLGESAAHTEFTRLLAEHGLLGVIALGLMATMLVQAYRWAPSQWNRLMVVALAVWSLTTMLHAATRIGAVGTMLALTQLRVEDPPSNARRR